jgi:hypothetical protein
VTELETDPQKTAQRLSDLDESERNHLFSQLQERMPAVWDAWNSASRMSLSSSCRQ